MSIFDMNRSCSRCHANESPVWYTVTRTARDGVLRGCSLQSLMCQACVVALKKEQAGISPRVATSSGRHGMEDKDRVNAERRDRYSSRLKGDRTT